MIHLGIIEMTILILSMVAPLLYACRKPKQNTTDQHTPYTGPVYNRHGREIG